MDIKTIDIVAMDETTQQVNMIIMDSLKWDDPEGHIDALQAKILFYEGYIDSGELVNHYPQASGHEVIIRVVFEHEPESEMVNFMEKVQDIVEEVGYHLEFVNFEQTGDIK